jgi:hypothetical protein
MVDEVGRLATTAGHEMLLLRGKRSLEKFCHVWNGILGNRCRGCEPSCQCKFHNVGVGLEGNISARSGVLNERE